MGKTNLAGLLSALLVFGLVSQSARAAQEQDTQTNTVAKIKGRVAKLGVGDKAKATVTLKDGTKMKGYIAEVGEDDFVVRDRNTNAPTTIRYSDVLKLERNRGHSTAKHIAIGVGIGVGAFLAVLGAVLAHLD